MLHKIKNMYVAKIRFSFGKETFEPGNPVPDEVVLKYPHLCLSATETNVKEKVVEPDPEGSVRLSISGKRKTKKKDSE